MPSGKQITVPFLRAEFPETAPQDLAAVLKSGYVGAGQKVNEFEEALSKYLGAPHVICTSSCTSALTLAYIQLGVKTGSVVLSTPITCVATNLPLLHLGADIKWLDIDPVTGNVTADTILQGLKRYPDARLVVIMDWAGRPCDYRAIEEVTLARGVSLVLDAAQSFGSLYEGKLFASCANYVCYSFGPTKIFSTIDGGAITTSNKNTAASLKTLRWYGVDRAARDPLMFWDYQIDQAGYRFTTNNICAAVGLHVLPRFHERLKWHRKIASFYQEELQPVSGIQLPPSDPKLESNFWMFTVIAEKREALVKKLHCEGIHAAIPHNRNDKYNCFVKMASQHPLPGVDHFSEHYLCLPIGPWVSEDDCLRISRLIRAGW